MLCGEIVGGNMILLSHKLAYTDKKLRLIRRKPVNRNYATTEDISTEKAENEDKPNTDTGVEGVAVVVGVAVVAGAAIIISRKKK